MMLVAGSFRVTHVSTHCSLRDAIERARKERILAVIRLTHDALRQMAIDEPRIAVAGLNPHAGESGLFGDEETREIVPAIQAARAEGINVYPGAVPPDTVFHRMASGQQFDAVVAMYHDQGHIPTKVLGFAEGVNVTLGLPIVRTSVDHGTVFGKAGKGTADPTSLKRAIELAVLLVEGRRERLEPIP
jgi:4-hydroxy-L-threonine phosphate dehydrogenase PdxA